MQWLSLDPFKPNPIVVKFHRLVSYKVAIDLGCGWGRDTIFLARRGFNVIAVDSDAEKLERIQRVAED